MKNYLICFGITQIFAVLWYASIIREVVKAGRFTWDSFKRDMPSIMIGGTVISMIVAFIMLGLWMAIVVADKII